MYLKLKMKERYIHLIVQNINADYQMNFTSGGLIRLNLVN
jgi:hypothetical protein